MTEQLRPCPFCGGDDVGIEHIGGEDWAAIVVQCRGCQAQGGMGWMERETGETYDEMISRITDEANVSWETRADDARISALMQTIERQNHQAAQAIVRTRKVQDEMVERLKAQADEIEELREALEALFVAAISAPPFGRMRDKVKWQDAMHKARAAIAGDSTKEKTK